jgi:hypothetical protein
MSWRKKQPADNMPKMLWSILLWLALPGLLLKPLNAAPQVNVSVNQAQIQFPDAIVFKLAAKSSQLIQKVSLRYWTNGQNCQTGGAVQPLTFDPKQSVALSWAWDFNRSGTIPPGTQVSWQWDITEADGTLTETPAQTVVFNDQRHTWSTLTQNGITLQWYSGSQAFGQSLMSIAVQGLNRLSSQMGVRPSGSIWITIYPTVDEVRAVLLHTYEWTGGVAFPQYGGIITSIVAGQDAWATSVLPHEISHLVVGAATYNCMGASLPTWLDEGLAVYAENNLTQADRNQVYQGLKDGVLLELRALTNGFSDKSNLANLEYLQSGIVVDFMLASYGAGKMTGLLAAVKDGTLIDEALQKTYGFDTAGLDAAWRTSLGLAVTPAATTPVGGTPTGIPTLALWTPIGAATEPVTPTVTPAQPGQTLTASPTQTPRLGQAGQANQVSTPTPAAAPPKPAGTRWPSCGAAASVLIAAVVLIRLRKK